MIIRSNMWSRLFVTFVALLLSASAGQAAVVLYSENFDDEGTAANAYDNGTTPEVNVGNIGVLQSNAESSSGGGHRRGCLSFPLSLQKRNEI